MCVELLLVAQLEKSSSTLVAAAEFYQKFNPDGLLICHYDDIKYFSIGYASGLIYLYGNRYQVRHVICNPITGRYAILPYRYTYRKAYSFFGFYPIDKQYKALSMIYPSGPGRSKILTFGDGDMRWSKIKYPVRHDIYSEGICINGVLYYLGDAYGWDNPHDVPPGNVIVCFDLRSENVTYIRVESFCQLINYKGKLAVTYWENDVYTNTINELHVWVLEDGEKHEWSKYAYTLSDDKFFRSQVSVAGMTASGEIVFSMRKYTSKQPFYVFYFNPERNNLRRVEIQGFGDAFKKTCSVCTFVNHVEDLNVNDLKQLKSVHPPLVQPEYVESDSESD
ncbi:F-box associated interaction domain [Arabidopsis thaliana x Arabidopsis arenosa]|uniref:F-box associated interaction domain n=1 Tax=Arabidopsis thaliana x Arabidopsis arenosa TaxID=1240361 RepID=A0A8T2AX91_9BRAS|nr:F-box associated interaction domain [Arabidopsis thaliana x Arabidopsis arenosa]